MWAKIDDGFWSHPKVEEVGNEAAGAFVRMLSYCADHLTDGRVTEGMVAYIARPKVVDRLLEFGFIERNGKGFVIPDYLDFNPSRADAEQMRAARAEAGRRGGQKSKPRSKGSSK